MWEAVLKRDRAVAATGLAGVAALAWLYTVYLAGALDVSTTGEAMAYPRLAPWGVGDLALTFVMWAAMMVGMMVPSAAPTILLYLSMNRGRREREAPYTATAVFVFGYLAAWLGFSLAATFVQWGLHNGALLAGRMGAAVPFLGGLMLVGAGVYQWTPLKYACLKKCRSPLGFLLGHWREGAWGAFEMGLRHGAFCVGCCWALMLILFATGTMNLMWMAVVTGLVLVEKVARGGQWVGRVAGLALVVWGGWTTLAALT